VGKKTLCFQLRGIKKGSTITNMDSTFNDSFPLLAAGKIM